MISNSVQRLWHAYLHSTGEDPATTQKTFTAWHFCDNAHDADELAALVKAGHKRATASAAQAYEIEEEALPAVGDLSIITNWAGEAQCLIRTTSVEIVPFNQVSARFAHTEGEGDGSLEHWRRVHWEVFSRNLQALNKDPQPTMPVVCETFEVLYPPEEHTPPQNAEFI